MRSSAQKTSGSQSTIAIIGGGFTGTTLAAQLLRHGSISVVVIEKHFLPGRGIAYGTQYGWHRLNVPAKDMSALPGDPEHFLRWAKQNYDDGVEAESFLPRRVYGQYIESVLRDANGSNRDDLLQWLQDDAQSISPVGDKVEIQLRGGSKVVADKVVLATGNFPPRDPHLPGRHPRASARYFPFAWSSATLEGLEETRSILLVGSGLTAVDLVIALRAREFRGTVHLLSRRGLLPYPHKPTRNWPVFWNEKSATTALGLLKLVREQARQARQEGEDWRAVIDSLRPVTPQIWQALPESERRRFLRHVRSYWEVHRHRVAPEIASLIAYQLMNGHIKVHGGSITRYVEDLHGVEVTYRNRRTGEEERLLVDRVINCTGPETDCRRLDDPLIDDLRSQGLVRPDPLYLGLEISADGALIDINGMPSEFLFAVGPARKGMLWETTAVPEIREQVFQLASLLLLKGMPSGAIRLASNGNPPVNPQVDLARAVDDF